MDAIWSQADEKRFSQTFNIDFSINSERPIIPKKPNPKKQSFLSRSENILQIHNEEGYNLLQKCVGLNNLDMIRYNQVNSS
jgi:hypothetical protein